MVLSREAAAAHSARPIAAAASRLTTFFVSHSAGLRPQLRAAATSWLRRATSKLTRWIINRSKIPNCTTQKPGFLWEETRFVAFVFSALPLGVFLNFFFG
jgi:hypothetical protein